MTTTAATGDQRTVVFDLDGTLADTAADLIAAANACFQTRGLGQLLDPVTDAGIAFHGGRAMLRAGYGRVPSNMLIPPGAEDEDFPRLLGFYDDGIAQSTRLYDGVETALDALATQGFILSVCTNKPEALADKLLTALGVRELFASLVGADTLPVRKPDPRPYAAAVERAGGNVARSFLVGDTETDLKTARSSGVPVTLVGFGPEGAGIARFSPDHILQHFDELPDLAADWLRPSG